MQIHSAAFCDWFVPEAYAYFKPLFPTAVDLAYISTWVSSELFSPLSPLPYFTAIWKKQKPTPQLHHQLLFCTLWNWMSATEPSRILMRVVSESKLLTWGVGTERRSRNGVESSQLFSFFFYLWLGCVRCFPLCLDDFNDWRHVIL